MLGSYRRERDSGKEYAKGVSKLFDDLTLSSPGIPSHLQKQYSLRILKLEQEGEKVADTDVIQKIKVIDEKEEKPLQIYKKNNEDDGDNEDNENGESENDERRQNTLTPDIRINMENITDNNIDSGLLDNFEISDKKRRKSVNEIDVSDIIIGDMEKPFDNERAKYELQRFLQAKEI